MAFCHLGEIYLTHTENNYWMLLQKTGLDALKTTSENIVHKVAEAAGEFPITDLFKKCDNIGKISLASAIKIVCFYAL